MKSLELFSGCGGMAKGLENAGFQLEQFVEMNKDACQTLRLNYDRNKVYEGDAKNFNFNALAPVDIIAGGPPCQPFSLGGKHNAFNDKRDMFPLVIDALDVIRPKAFIFENVKGLLRKNFEDYFNYILLRLSLPYLGSKPDENWSDHYKRLSVEKLTNKPLYHVKYKLINAADFGVPQKRERVFIVGFRADLSCEWDFPEPTHSHDSLLWEKHITGNYWQNHQIKVSSLKENKLIEQLLYKKYGLFTPDKKPWVSVRDAFKGLPCSMSHHLFHDHIYKSGAKSYQGHTGSELDLPAKTLKAGGHGVPGGENMVRYEDDSVRYFTTYEAKLLQTFPSDYQISGSWGETMRQIGNAVPVKLAEIIGISVREALGKTSLENI